MREIVTVVVLVAMVTFVVLAVMSKDEPGWECQDEDCWCHAPDVEP